METVRERNYRTAESLRQRNLREQRRLDESLRGRMGMQAKHETKLAAVTKEQLQLKQELAKIRTTGTTTTWGVLPPREDGGNHGNRNGHHVHVKPGKSTSNNHVASSNGKASQSSRAEHEKKKEQRRMSHLEDRMVVFKKSLGNDDSEGVNDRTQSTSINKKDVNADAILVDRLVIGDDNNSNTSSNTQGDPSNLGSQNSKTNLNNSRKTSVAGHSSSEPGHKEAEEAKPAANESADSAISKPEQGQSTAASSRLPKNSDSRRQSQPLTQTQTQTHAQAQAQRKGGQPGAGFDSKRYNPDGSLRTVHVLPDFGSRWSEAKKARYIRHKNKPDHEQELSVKEMFGKDSK